MSTPASIGRHPIHPILVALPIGLWVFSVVADMVFQLGWGPAVWKDVACYTLAGGIVGALLAAIPGFIDFLSITEARARRTGIAHMVANLIALVVFGASLWLRSINAGGWLPVAFSIAGLVALGAAGWLGGELVFVHNMGVQPPKPAARHSKAGSQRRIA